ncbi:scavenger receptor class B member 1-like [Thrips palmi]|uniref:Scavenger receptor class B member 1-like n=1 Tax=Thrips palmi TaxID=161013 RepID=A0A6P8Y4I6_THRPL|nr:scavenger receptor class B member 1-like [Thrips palmi]XP_034234474.1 scavenger receptor class B member 1-like [Thrips palmi]
MVLQNIGGGSAESVTVGCLDWDRFDRQWQDCVQDYRYHPHRDARHAGRSRNTPQRSENLRRNLPPFRVLRLLGTIGVALLALAYAVYLVNPIEIAINVRMSFLNGSFLFGLWRKPPVSIYVQVYLFNVTNPREFLRGQEKLRVEEVGPFVYREELENTGVKFNENDTVTYTPKRNVFPVPELSVGDPRTTVVIAPNLALLGLASSLHNSSIFTNIAFATLTSYLDTQPFLHLTVHDFLWGFDDPLVHLASKLFPKWIHFPRLGVMDRMFDDGENVVTMNVYGDDDGKVPSADLAPAGTNDTFSRRAFAIDSWNGSPGLAHWGYGKGDDHDSATVGTRCNTIRGATEGILFPRNIRKDMRFSVYRKAFCRTLPLQFVREGPTPDHVPAYWYTLGDDIFETADVNPDNSCYCRPEVAPCLPRGLSDLTPCYYDIPAAVSLPHFYKADERLLEKIDGLHPNESLHATTLAIQPRVGVPLVAHIRVQTNLVVHKTKGNPRVAPFNNLTVPIFWVDLTVRGLPDSLSSLLDLMLRVAPIIQTTVIAVLVASGALLLVSAAVGVCCTAGMLHATRRPPVQDAYKYSQVKIIKAVKPAAAPESLVLSLGRDPEFFGKGRA